MYVYLQVSVVNDEHFQTTTPLKPLGNIYFTYILICTTQNLIRIKLLFLFAGCPANLIPKMLLEICCTTIPL